ncbi:glycosyltransferase family 4 protein [Candidatus Uhrbacteria bacterium]|nr:glycosyltransferase family 4 protein [Candidatus Uhrbacteria bacterium]
MESLPNASKKRIVILCLSYTPYISGAERFVVEVVKRIRHQYRVTVITARFDRRLPKQEMLDGVEVIRVGFGNWFDKFLYPFFSVFKTAALNPDLVHGVVESAAGGALMIYKWFHPKTPTLLTLQSGSMDAPRIKRWLPDWLFAWIHRTPDAIHAISKALADRAVRLGAKKVSIIPNGVELTAFEKVRGTQKIPGSIVAVGRLHVDKGYDVLIQAFSKIAQKYSEATLSIAGEGDERAHLTHVIKTLGLETRVKLLGNVPYQDIPPLIARAEVFVVPSRAEGMGIVFVEAQAAGTAVIGSRTGGIPDVIQDGETGLMVPVEDVESLTQAMDRLLGEPSVREELVKQASQNLSRYSWDQIAREIDVIYQTCFHASLKMRVLLCTGIYPPQGGGPATYVRNFAQASFEAGYPISVVTYGDDTTERHQPWPVSVVPRFGGPVIRYLRYTWHTFWQARSTDVIYAQDAVSQGLPGAIVAGLLGKPFVLKVVGDYAWEIAQQMPGGHAELLDAFLTRRHTGRIGWIERIERWVARRANAVIVPSRYLATMVERWGIVREKIHVVYTQIAPLPKTASRAELRAREGWKEGDVILFTNVRAVPWKGVDFLVDILQDLPSNYYLVHVGEGPELAKWRTMVEDRGLSSRVRLLGRVDRHVVAEWCEMADRFVLASGYEGFAHVVVEAVSRGLPCVVSDQAGNPEAKELFPEYVTVLPYLNRVAWTDELRRLVPRHEPKMMKPFSEVVQQTHAILKHLCTS